MNVSAQSHIAYTTQISNLPKAQQPQQTEHKEEQTKTIDVNSFKLKSLDDESNKILNSLLVGKTDKEKEIMKISLDSRLSHQFTVDEKGSFIVENFENNSKEVILERLDVEIFEESLAGKNDELLQIMKQLRELYKHDYSPLDIKA